jgi:outer membrane receptor protein involved in Fe transport
MTRLSLATLLACALAAPVLAQTAIVTGTVHDESGAAVPGATVELVGPATMTPTVSGSRGEYSFRDVRPGTYKIQATLVGFAPAMQNDIVVGTSNVEVPALTLRIASLTDTVVVSATKSEATLIDAPATMSVVTAETRQSTPAQNYGDLLRAVPGANVIQMSARDVNITSRQATSTLTSSQLVLLDDRSIYLDFFGIVLWDFMPVSMSDIKQIEVVRGPASAVWGANALTGAVNIITKPPRQSVGTTASITFGGFSRDAGSGLGKGMGKMYGANATYSGAPNDKWSYRVSAGYFNSDPFARPAGAIPVIQDPRDPTRTVGGASYPPDQRGAGGTSFENSGTSQPKFSARVDQEINGGRITYEGGVAGTSGIIHTVATERIRAVGRSPNRPRPDGVRELLVRGEAGGPRRSQSVSGRGAVAAAGQSVQHRLQRRREPLSRERVGELFRQGVLERRPERTVLRLHRFVRHAEQQLRDEVGRWKDHDAGEGHESS